MVSNLDASKVTLSGAIALLVAAGTILGGPCASAQPEVALPLNYLYSVPARRALPSEFGHLASTNLSHTDPLQIGPDGVVYLADQENHRIQMFASDGRYVGQWGEAGIGDGRLQSLTDMRVAPSGDVFVRAGPSIQRFDSRGRFLGNGQPWQLGVAAPQGDSYYVPTVYRTPAGEHSMEGPPTGRIRRYAPDGKAMQVWDIDKGRWEAVTVADMVIAADGTVVVADTVGRIQRFSADGAFLGLWTWSGGVDNVTMTPYGDREIVIGAYNSNILRRFTITGEHVQDISLPASDPTKRVLNVVAATNGTLYVLFNQPDSIEHITADGRLLQRWGFWYGVGDHLGYGKLTSTAKGEIVLGPPAVLGQILGKDATSPVLVLGTGGEVRASIPYTRALGLNPTHMATTATVAAAGDESIWVIAGEIHSGSQVTGSLSVARIAYDGSLLARWPLEPFVDSHFTFLTQLDLVTSSNGDVVVLDGWRGRIGRYSPAGELLAQWSLPDFDGGPGSTARSVIDGGPNDTVLLVQSLDATESPPARLTIFDAGGAVLNSWAIEEELPSHMSWSHYSLTVTPDERVLVGIAHGSDTYRRSIRAYMLDGRQVGSWQVPSASPEWLADTSEGGPMLANMESLPDGRLVIDDRAQRGTNMTSGLRVYGPAREDAWHGAFYAEPFMPGHPAASVVYPGGPLDLDWGPAPPTDGLPSDGFAVRLHRLVQVPVGTHRFTVAAHGGIRLWVGTRLLIDRWDAESVSETAEAFLRPGQYDIQLDFTDPNGAASLHFDWQPGSPGSRLFMPRVEFTPGSTRSPSAIGRNFAQRETVTRGP